MCTRISSNISLLRRKWYLKSHELNWGIIISSANPVIRGKYGRLEANWLWAIRCPIVEFLRLQKCTMSWSSSKKFSRIIYSTPKVAMTVHYSCNFSSQLFVRLKTTCRCKHPVMWWPTRVRTRVSTEVALTDPINNSQHLYKVNNSHHLYKVKNRLHPLFSELLGRISHWACETSEVFLKTRLTEVKVYIGSTEFIMTALLPISK